MQFVHLFFKMYQISNIGVNNRKKINMKKIPKNRKLLFLNELIY